MLDACWRVQLVGTTPFEGKASKKRSVGRTSDGERGLGDRDGMRELNELE